MRYVLVCLQIWLLLPTYSAQAKSVNPTDSLNLLKGQIWKITVNQFWADQNLPINRKLRAWQGPNEFYSQINNPTAWPKGVNLEQLRVLVEDVKSRFDKDQKVTPQLLANTILIVSNQNSARSSIKHVDSLEHAFIRLLPINTVVERQVKNDSSNDTLGASKLVTEADSTQVLLPKDRNNYPKANDSQNWLLGLAALFGALAGSALTLIFMRKKPRPTAINSSKTVRSKESDFMADSLQSPTVQRLNGEIGELKGEISELKQQLSSLTTKQPNSRQKGSSKAGGTTVPTAPDAIAKTPPVAISSADLRTENLHNLTDHILYGPAPEIPVIEHRKFSSTPLPQLPIRLSIANLEATVGHFELSPYVNQLRLIGDGIKELSEFFDFPRPLPEYFSIIKPVRPGVLTRQGEIWSVETKAKIELL